MKIAIFGATGKVGMPLVDLALDRGHDVTAFVRDPQKLEIRHLNLDVIQGDVHDLQAVKRAVARQQAVISVLGSTGRQTDVMQTAGINLVDAMQAGGVRRLIVLTGAGVQEEGDRPQLPDRIITRLLKITAGDVYEDAVRGINLIRGSELDWTVVRAPMLVDGGPDGKIRVGFVGVDTGRRITRADVAAFLLDQLEDPTYIRQSPMISN